jgi:hypothetical protein
MYFLRSFGVVEWDFCWGFCEKEVQVVVVLWSASGEKCGKRG